MCVWNSLNVLELRVSIRQMSETKMQTAQQAEKTVKVPQIAPVSESSESTPKSTAAGVQERAGSRISPDGCSKGFSRDAMAEALATVDVGMVVTSLLKSKRE